MVEEMLVLPWEVRTEAIGYRLDGARRQGDRGGCARGPQPPHRAARSREQLRTKLLGPGRNLAIAQSPSHFCVLQVPPPNFRHIAYLI
jgi:hypothetical protein